MNECLLLQAARGIVTPKRLHEAAIAMSQAMKEGKSEAEALEALAQSQQKATAAAVAAGATVKPRSSTRERRKAGGSGAAAKKKMEDLD